jgi:hypothetical protein
MFGRPRKRRRAERAVEFCESSGEVCTPGWWAEDRRARARVEALYELGQLR